MLAFPGQPASIGYWVDVNRARAPVFVGSIEDGGFLFSNPSAARLFRGESGTLVGQKSHSFRAGPEERAATREKIQHQGKAREVETRIRSFHGSILLGTPS